MSTLLADVVFALRSFRRTPTVTIVALTMLALGIGAATATYSVVQGVLLRSLPFVEPEELVDIKAIPLAARRERGGGTVSRFGFESIRAQSRSFEDVAGYTGSRPVLTGMGEPERIQAWSVTSNFFPLLGLQPAMGRGLSAEDEQASATPVAVVSHGFWTARLAGDPNVLGRTLALDGTAVEIVGVMPPDARYPANTAVWRALRLTTASPTTGHPQGGLWIVGRLGEGVAEDQAQAEMDALAQRLAADAPAFAKWTMNLTPLHDYGVGEVRTPLYIMLGAVGFVLLVACANVANLLLARAVIRRREIAIRSALGAARSRLVRQLLTESVLLALAGGALGVLLAYRGVPALSALGSGELPAVAEITVDVRVLAVATGVMVLTGLLFGMVPALHAIRGVSADALRAARTGGATWRNRASDAFVVAQVALTMILLTGAALLGTSFTRLVNVDPGFEPDQVVTAQLVLPSRRYADSTTMVRFADAVMERLRAMPGVNAVTVSSGVPFATGALGSYSVGGEDVEGPPAHFTSATPEFFRTFGIPLRRGRLFGEAAGNAGEIVVSEELVRHAFRGEDPIGKQVTFFGSRVGRIVGVVGTTRQRDLGEEPWPDIYWQFDGTHGSYTKVSVRTTSADASSLAGAIRSVVREVDPLLPVDKVSTVRALISESVARQRFYSTLLGVFSAITLLMAAAGIFGLAMFAVGQRTHELGVRIALGARPRQVASLVLSRAGWLAMIGIALGVGGALATTRLLDALLFQVEATEPIVFASVAIALAVVAIAASWIPARRAMKVQPVIALRAE